MVILTLKDNQLHHRKHKHYYFLCFIIASVLDPEIFLPKSLTSTVNAKDINKKDLMQRVAPGICFMNHSQLWKILESTSFKIAATVTSL